MTAEELKNFLNLGISVLERVTPYIPSTIDDEVLEGLRALAASDALLEFIARLIPSGPWLFNAAGGASGSASATGSGEQLVLMGSDGTVQASLDPAFWVMLIQVLAPLIKDLIERLRDDR